MLNSTTNSTRRTHRAEAKPAGRSSDWSIRRPTPASLKAAPLPESAASRALSVQLRGAKISGAVEAAHRELNDSPDHSQLNLNTGNTPSIGVLNAGIGTDE